MKIKKQYNQTLTKQDDRALWIFYNTPKRDNIDI